MTQHSETSTMTHASGPPPGTIAIVDVYADPVSGGGVQFSHEWKWQGGTSQGNGRVDVPAKGKSDPSTPIHFNLKDRTGRGFDFSDAPTGCIWVDRTSCPTSSSTDPEIPSKDIQRSNNLLKIVDLNQEACTLHYSLWFKDSQGKYESYDPDIKNGGSN